MDDRFGASTLNALSKNDLSWVDKLRTVPNTEQLKSNTSEDGYGIAS